MQHDAPSVVARFCRSHAQYEGMETTYKDLPVALVGKSWKGKRVENLELKVIDLAPKRLDRKRWDVYEKIDTIFEIIAVEGDKLLASTLYPS